MNMNMYNWDNRSTLEIVKRNLSGAATQWYLGNEKRITKFDAFQQLFRNIFVRESSSLDKWRRMNYCLQSKNESTAMYFHDKVRLCKSYELLFNDIKQAVIVGLRSRDLASRLTSGSAASVEELLWDIRQFESISELHKQSFSELSYRSNTYSWRNKGAGVPVAPKKELFQKKKEEFQINNLSNVISGEAVSSRLRARCFNCQDRSPIFQLH